MRLAPEGIPFVLGGAVGLAGLAATAGVFGGLWWAAAVAWLPVAGWIPWFFRDPRRSGPRGDNLIVAPADGRVVSVAKVEEPDFIGGAALRVSVFMNFFNVHVNRHPVSGTTEFRAYREGKFVNASLDKASIDNEQMSLGVSAARGPVLVRQIAGLVARRIVTDPQPGDEVRQGDRLGLIRFGSRVDTFFRPDARATVSVGERTVAGVTVIGEWS